MSTIEDAIRGDADTDIDVDVFRMMAENVPGVLYAYDVLADGTRVLVHLLQGLERILGDEGAALVARDINELFARIHPDDAPRLARDAENAQARGEVLDTECRLRHDDGRYLWVRSVARPQRLADGSNRWHVVLIDITSQRTIDDELRRHEARMRLLLDQTPAIIWTTDRQLRYTSSSGAGLKALGLVAGQVVGMTLYEYFHTLDASFMPIQHHLAALSGEPREYDIEHRGEFFQTRIEPLRDSSGEIVGTIGVAHNISALKRHEEQLHAARERERLLFRELDHRVRNNLSALVSLVDLSARAAKSTEEFAAVIRGRIQAMAAAHSLLSGGRRRPTHLSDLIDALVPAALRDRIACERTPPIVPGDRTSALSMIIHELLANSMKHGALANDTGRVRCAWHAAAAHEGAKDPSRVTLRWTETGGPPVPARPAPGAGTRLIEGLVRNDMRGSVRLNYTPNGADHELTFALSSDSEGNTDSQASR